MQSVAARSLPQSGGGLSFPGTVHVGGDTLVVFLREYLASLSGLPFARLVVVNGHFENEPFIFEALDQVRQSGALDDKEVLAFSWWSLVQESWLRAELAEFPGWHAEHAGVTETSLMLHLRPDLVREDRPAHDRPPRSGVYLHPIDVRQTTNNGVLSSTEEPAPRSARSSSATSSRRRSPWSAAARGCCSRRPGRTAVGKPSPPREVSHESAVPSRVHLQLHPRRLAGPLRLRRLPWDGKFYTDVAQALERACFDYLIVEDKLMIPESYGGSSEAVLKQAMVAPSTTRCRWPPRWGWRPRNWASSPRCRPWRTRRS
ncbi:creatininase family protein [Streptomyces sp. M19]